MSALIPALIQLFMSRMRGGGGGGGYGGKPRLSPEEYAARADEKYANQQLLKGGFVPQPSPHVKAYIDSINKFEPEKYRTVPVDEAGVLKGLGK